MEERIAKLVRNVEHKLAKDMLSIFEFESHLCSKDQSVHLERVESLLRIVALIPTTNVNNLDGMHQALLRLLSDLEQTQLWSKFKILRSNSDSNEESDSSDGEDQDDLEAELQEEFERLQSICPGCASTLKFYMCAPAAVIDCITHPFNEIYEKYYDDKAVKASCKEAFKLLESERAVVLNICRHAQLLLED